MAVSVGVCKDGALMGLKGTNLFVLVVMGVLSLIFTQYAVHAEMALSEEEEDLAFETQLKILNKPAIKTIQTEWGDIIDCVDIHKQPAFDHPLLKNHKIQMKPNFIPKATGDETSSTNKTKPSRGRSSRNGCPNGTVPIRRTRKEDLIRAKSLTPKTFLDANDDSVQYVTGLLYQITGETYYGASADIDTFNPDLVQPDQFTSAEIFVAAGPFNKQSNGIYLGWTVHPRLYGNNITRSFTFWTGGNGTGCYNTLCPGFVQVDKIFTPDYPIDQISTYGGLQYPINDKVYQDRQTGNWWLVYDDNTMVGYWPNSLFPLFGAGAQYIYWGGHVATPRDRITPRMGSGHFPDGDYTHSTYFAKIKYMDESNMMLDPKIDKIQKISGCGDWVYRVRYYGYKNNELKHTFQFGGPGGKCA